MGAILLLMTIGGSIIAAVLLAFSIWKDKAWLKSFVLGGVFVWYSFYIIIFLMSSAFSQEKTLGLNEAKEFCGFYLDCHMHTAVSEVRKTKTLGDRTAAGAFYIVTVKVFSNARREPLHLVETEARVVDDQKRDQESEPPPDRRFLSEDDRADLVGDRAERVARRDDGNAVVCWPRHPKSSWLPARD